MYEWSF
jgi:hypothetical protein